MMIFDFGLVGAAYAMFHAAHGIADYWVQTDWQAQNKSKNWKALWSHGVTYGLCFIPVAAFLQVWAGVPTWKCLALPFVILLPHVWMDRRKFLGWFLDKTKGWTPNDECLKVPVVAAVRVHVTIHMDQKFHYLCLLLTALWIGWE